MEQSTIEVTVSAVVHKSLNQVWTLWTEPEHVKNWNNASPDWHTPHAENDLTVGGKFTYTMAAKDGSFSFDFWGVYNEIIEFERLVIRLGDERNMSVSFSEDENGNTVITETFDAESQNPVDLQRQGWQAILDNFKDYAESK